MDPQQAIVSFVQQHVEPLPAYPPHGKRYRVSATLSDGTFLPCVVVQGVSHRVDHAIKRFDETYKSSDPYMGYRNIVKLFVARNNTVNDADLKSLATSRFAIPPARIAEIGGETSMGWTAFQAEMMDGAIFDFGTTYLTEFFEMPEGYSGPDIARIIPAKRGVAARGRVYRERPFFTCYVNGL